MQKLHLSEPRELLRDPSNGGAVAPYPPPCSKSTGQERRRRETSQFAMESNRVRTCSVDDTVCVRRSDNFSPAFPFSFHYQLRKHSDRHY